jgi:hypothetical protein
MDFTIAGDNCRAERLQVGVHGCRERHTEYRSQADSAKWPVRRNVSSGLMPSGESAEVRFIDWFGGDEAADKGNTKGYGVSEKPCNWQYKTPVFREK